MEGVEKRSGSEWLRLPLDPRLGFRQLWKVQAAANMLLQATGNLTAGGQSRGEDHPPRRREPRLRAKFFRFRLTTEAGVFTASSKRATFCSGRVNSWLGGASFVLRSIGLKAFGEEKWGRVAEQLVEVHRAYNDELTMFNWQSVNYQKWLVWLDWQGKPSCCALSCPFEDCRSTIFNFWHLRTSLKIVLCDEGPS